MHVNAIGEKEENFLYCKVGYYITRTFKELIGPILLTEMSTRNISWG
jgi:hypothetical protein